jgi:hypothetical protein
MIRSLAILAAGVTIGVVAALFIVFCWERDTTPTTPRDWDEDDDGIQPPDPRTTLIGLPPPAYAEDDPTVVARLERFRRGAL